MKNISINLNYGGGCGLFAIKFEMGIQPIMKFNEID